MHRVRTFKLSNASKFAHKLKNVVGHYVDPPAHAVVRAHRHRPAPAMDG